MTDPIADMLARLRNGSKALLPAVDLPYSKMKEAIARILKSEGYVADYSVECQGAKTLKVKLKYHGRKSVIEGLRRVSKPGLRRYVGATGMPRVLGGMGTVIVSTPRGVMTGIQASRQSVGGELICYVW